MRTLTVLSHNDNELVVSIRDKKVTVYLVKLVGNKVIWYNSNDNVVYDVTLVADWPSECTCPGHIHYAHKQDCRHVAATKKLIDLSHLKPDVKKVLA